MSFDAPDLRAWLAERLRGTNWIAAGIAGALQLGFLAVFILMTVVTSSQPHHERLVAVLSTSPQQKPTPPQPSEPQPPSESKAAPAKAEVVAPPPPIQIAAAPPITAAPERAPEPPTPAAAPPARPAPAAAPAGPSGPIAVNLKSNLISKVSPVPPPSSQRKREAGTVVLRLIVGEDGRVDQISIQESSGFPALDQAALVAVRQWRWSPQLQDGRAVRVTGLVPITFKARD